MGGHLQLCYTAALNAVTPTRGCERNFHLSRQHLLTEVGKLSTGEHDIAPEPSYRYTKVYMKVWFHLLSALNKSFGKTGHYFRINTENFYFVLLRAYYYGVK